MVVPQQHVRTGGHLAWQPAGHCTGNSQQTEELDELRDQPGAQRRQGGQQVAEDDHGMLDRVFRAVRGRLGMGARSCARSLRSHGAWLTSDVHGSSPRRAAPRPLLQVIPTGLRVVTSASLQNLVDYHILVGAPRLVLEATREAINMPGALDALSGALGSKLAMHAANLFVDDYFNGFTRVATDMGFEAGCGAPVLEDVELAGLDALRGGGLAATKKVKVVDNLSYDGEPSLMYCTGSIYSRVSCFGRANEAEGARSGTEDRVRVGVRVGVEGRSDSPSLTLIPLRPH
mmetsp:Transcript_55416/g.152626  ORF Transcript_55416/g.152626 Transcript_55416/m.152626 type:complete len:288 (+) Transcript_55416:864-1727(+)